MHCEQQADRNNAYQARETIMEIKWEEGSEIRVRIEDQAVTISANREGLLSLAEQFTMLADEKTGSHIHYDESNSLEEGSDELVVEIV